MFNEDQFLHNFNIELCNNENQQLIIRLQPLINKLITNNLKEFFITKKSNAAQILFSYDRIKMTLKKIHKDIVALLQFLLEIINCHDIDEDKLSITVKVINKKLMHLDKVIGKPQNKYIIYLQNIIDIIYSYQASQVYVTQDTEGMMLSFNHRYKINQIQPPRIPRNYSLSIPDAQEITDKYFVKDKKEECCSVNPIKNFCTIS